MPVIERATRTIKERTRSLCHSSPYRVIPKLTCRELVATTTKWINTFLTKSGISQTMSGSRIVEGKNVPDLSLLQITF